MTPLARAICLAASTLLPLTAASAQAQPDLQLACDGGLASPLCRSVASVLAEAVGPVTLAPELAPGRTGLRLMTDSQGRDVLSAHIAWQTADGRHGTGPVLTLSVMDADLTPAMFDRFAVEMLRHSGLPL
ncbi:MAG: hypothetical protein KDK24_16090 [Pseudooceanicola sp.]|nr:hypothetical protein [Pseudooceanicola sp.]